MEIDGEDIKQAIANSDLPDDLKAKLVEDMPELLEHVNEASRTVYDPNAIWLEAIQYADEVEQVAKHLLKSHEDSCATASVAALGMMSKQFKRMAESAMQVLDTLKVESDLTDWATVKITHKKGNDAQQ